MSESIQEQLQALLQRVPPELQPIVVEYGPLILSWTADEAWAWVNLLAAGRLSDARDKLVATATDSELLALYRKALLDAAAANIEYVERNSLIRKAGTAILNAVLTIVLARLGVFL